MSSNLKRSSAMDILKGKSDEKVPEGTKKPIEKVDFKKQKLALVEQLGRVINLREAQKMKFQQKM